MNAAERRNEIISILLVRHHITAKELAGEFDVTVRTIKSDIQALSFAYPIYTKPGVAGGNNVYSFILFFPIQDSNIRPHIPNYKFFSYRFTLCCIVYIPPSILSATIFRIL